MGLLSRLFRFGRQDTKQDELGSQSGIITPCRQLFLDDDPTRAGIFLAENPTAVWVQTAEECISRLEEPWNEVHLDHDLGGEHFVDHTRDDCGMEVVRWLCLHSGPHLRSTWFYVHSHNSAAAATMAMQLMVAGYFVELRPFGTGPLPPLPSDFLAPPPVPASPLAMLVDWLRRQILRRSTVPDYGYPDPGRDGESPGTPPLERLKLDWTRPGALRPRSDEAPPCPEPLDLSWAAPRPPAPAGTEPGPPPASP